MPSSESVRPRDFRQKYRNLKRKLKTLIYENESFQEDLKKAQRKLLKVGRDKSFLLDRLLPYETVESSTSDSEATVSSDSDAELKPEIIALKKKKISSVEKEDTLSIPGCSGVTTVKKKSRKAPQSKPVNQPSLSPNIIIETLPLTHTDGRMTSEEIERHLESKQALRDLLPEKTPLTVPVELFSNDPSGLDCDLISQANVSSPNVVEGVSEDDGLIIDLHE